MRSQRIASFHSDSELDSASDGSISPPPSPVDQRSTLTARLDGTAKRSGSAQIHAEGALPLDLLADWEKDRQGDPTARLAQTMLSRMSMSEVLVGRDAQLETPMVFNHSVEMAGLPVTAQGASGRCWLFAACNVLRVFLARKYMIPDLQLSQSYLHFWDLYSKSEYFLHQMINFVEEPLDGRLMQKLMKEAVADGGTYDVACSLVQRFGVVPRSVYGESFNSSSSEELSNFLTSKMREYTLELRAEYVKLRARGKGRKEAARGAEVRSKAMMQEVYRCLAISLGTPPAPNTEFTWCFSMTHGYVVSLKRTPLSLLELDITPTYDIRQSISLMHDPRPEHRMHTVYQVEHTADMVGGREPTYLNVEMDEMKQVAIYLIQASIPVWFGCDVDKASNDKGGIFALKLYNYSDAFGALLNLTKAHRLQTKDGEPTHAMMLSAVHLDPHTSKPVRWQVQNSWGADVGRSGFWCMTDEWFSEHVYYIGAPRSFIPAHLLAIYDEGEVHKLPPWDPLA